MKKNIREALILGKPQCDLESVVQRVSPLMEKNIREALILGKPQCDLESVVQTV
jgi:hypothetical protein